MQSEKNKAKRILQELLGYYFSHEIDDLNINLHCTNVECTITLTGKTPSKPNDLKQLRETLNSPRQPEVEEYYWQLLGVSNEKHELNLVGSLIDSAEVTYDKGILKITVCRKK